MSVVSSLNQPTTGLPLKPIQSGPYTKAHFQSTIEGARNVKSIEEIEHLLRDYPAALELYRTGKYKVKVKCEVDVERVILVEKRSAKAKLEKFNRNEISPTPDRTQDEEQTKAETDDDNKSISNHQNEISDENFSKETLTHTASSSFRMPTNAQPKVDQQRAPSKDRLSSITPTVKRQVPSSENVDVHHDSSKNPINDYSNRTANTSMINTNGGWPQNPINRPLHPYWNNTMVQKGQVSNPYASSLAIGTQPNPYYQRTRIPSLNQTPTTGPILPTQSRTLAQNQHLSTSRNSVNINLPPVSSAQLTHRSINAKQYPIPMTPTHFQSQMTMSRKHPWANMYAGSSRPFVYNQPMQLPQAQTVRNRARSVDPNARRPNSVISNQAQVNPMNMMGFYWNRPDMSMLSNPVDRPVVDQTKQQTQPTANVQPEKLSIRQLQETFQQMNTAGRLPIQVLPDLLKRFGIVADIQELIKAAQELQYNYNEPISARRLVHMLVKLGRIAKSAPTAQRSKDDQETTNANSS